MEIESGVVEFAIEGATDLAGAFALYNTCAARVRHGFQVEAMRRVDDEHRRMKIGLVDGMGRPIHGPGMKLSN